ncbi:hypothetical protein HMPREF9946_03162 [Acetobacteraceae bacterium AT-5844]|nr:hypothetical protein HMPREF9946_03162 [Acetobacteraceae bacterium AT-5844]
MPLNQPETQDEIHKLRSRVHELSNQLMAQGRAPTKQPPSSAAIIGLAASAVAVVVGSITIGSLLFNMGGTVREMQITQNGFTAALARMEASVNTGRDQRERDVNRLETLIKALDAEQRAMGSRLTRQEVLQGVQRPTPQSDSGPMVAGVDLLPVTIKAVWRDLTH